MAVGGSLDFDNIQDAVAFSGSATTACAICRFWKKCFTLELSTYVSLHYYLYSILSKKSTVFNIVLGILSYFKVFMNGVFGIF